MARIMQREGSAMLVARWVALGALFLIPFTPLIVANTFFFPFISGKAFYFRILVEIAFAAWVVLAASDERYRPRFTWTEITVFAFVGWMFIADLFGPNVLKAFWSNFERMEGWVLLAHLAMFFVAAGAVLKVENKWRWWFLTSLGASLLVLGYAFFQEVGVFQVHQGATRVDATFGNSIYLAIYLLFNTFIASWLAFTEERPWLKWSLFALSLISIVFIFLTQTRGTFVALVGALTLCAVLTIIYYGGKPRRFAAGGLIVLVILVGGFFSLRDSDFVKHNDLLNRIAHISLADGQTRFTIWHIAWQGFLERPVAGWGQEGFNYVFNKYYDPSLYAQEPWFDRAHNAFIDWLMAGGLPALLLYIGLFGVGIWTLWKSPMPRAPRIALTAALVGYGIHNLFVFDNLYSYVYFFAILALIDSHVVPKPEAQSKKGAKAHHPSADTANFALPISAAVLLVVVYFVNISGIQVAQNLIRALSPQPGGIADNKKIFEELAAHPSFAAQEVREQLISFANQVVQSGESNDFKVQVVTLAITEMEKELKAHPMDAREHLQLALVYRTIGVADKAMAEFDAAIALSPKKEQTYLQKGINQLETGNFAEAKKTFEIAYALGPQFPEIAKFTAIGELAAGDVTAANEILTAHPEIAADVEALMKQLSAAKK